MKLRYWIITATFLGCSIAWYFQFFLSYDASSHLVYILQTAWIHPMEGRLTALFFELPAFLVFNFFSDDLSVLIYSYGLVYAYLPLISMLLFHRFVRENDQMFYIGALGIILPTLVNVYVPLSEHLIACQLFWPLLALVAKPNSFKYNLVAVLLMLILTNLHPVAFVLILIFSIYNIYINPGIKGARIISIIGFFLVAMRLLMTLTGTSDQESLDLNRIINTFFRGTDPWLMSRNMALLYILFLSASVIFFFTRNEKKKRFQLALLFLGGICIMIWPFTEPKALDYSRESRFGIWLFNMPFYLAYMVAASTRDMSAQISKWYSRIALGFYLIVIVEIGLVRSHYMKKLDGWVAENDPVCFNIHNLIASDNEFQFFEHWASTYEYLLHEGDKVPENLLVHSDDCSRVFSQDSLMTFYYGNDVDAPFTFPRNAYFDFDSVHILLKQQQP